MNFRHFLMTLVVIFLLAMPFQKALSYVTSQAHNQSKADLPKWMQPLMLEFVLISEQTRDRMSLERNGLYNKLDTAITYAVTPKDDVRLFGSYIYEVVDTADNRSYPELVEGMYRRKFILEQKQHGVNLDLELKSYYVADPDLRRFWGYNGAFIPQFVASKSWGRRFFLEGKVRHHINMRNNGKDYTTGEESRLYLTPTLVMTRNLWFSTEFKYRHKNRVEKTFIFPDKSDSLNVRPSLMYLLGRKALAEVYADTITMKSHDGHFFSEKLNDELVLGAALYLTAF